MNALVTFTAAFLLGAAVAGVWLEFEHQAAESRPKILKVKGVEYLQTSTGVCPLIDTARVQRVKIVPR